MSISRISSRFPRIVSAQCRNSIVTSSRHHPLPVPSNQFHSLGESHYKVHVGGQGSLFHHSLLQNAYAFQRFGFSSVPSPENPEKENFPPGDGGSTTVENSGATAKASGDAEAPQQREASVSEAPIQDQIKQENNTAPLLTASSRWNPTQEQLQALEDMYEGGTRTPTAYHIKLIAGELRQFGKIEGKNVFYWFKNHRARERQKRRREHRGSLESEVPDSSKELTMEDLVKLVTQKEKLLKVKHKHIEKMQGKVLRTCADMVNVTEKTRGVAGRAIITSNLALMHIFLFADADVLLKIVGISSGFMLIFCELWFHRGKIWNLYKN